MMESVKLNNSVMTHSENTLAHIQLVCINPLHFQCDLTPIPDWVSSYIAHQLCSSVFI